MVNITDAASHQTGFSYDSLGKVTQVTFPSSMSESYTYDAVNNLLAKTDRKGQTINYTYDFLNRLSNKAYPNGSGVSYTYDLVSRLTQVTDPSGTYSFTYDNVSRMLSTGTQYSFLTGTLTNSYTYDGDSSRTSLTDAQGVTTYSYDSLKRLTGIQDYAGNNLGFSYDALGRRTGLARPNGVSTSYSYDTLSRLLGVVHQAGAITLDGALYTYDAAGNRTSKTVLPSGPAYNYSYDPIYQLTQALRTSDNTITESYTYDVVGNRRSALNTPYTYNSSNEMLTLQGTSYTYDANGNTLSKTNSTGTTSYTWDYENRLTSATLPGTGGTLYFTYDPFGRRIEKISPTAGTTIYTYDGDNEVSQLTATGGLQVRFTQGLGIDEPLVEQRPTRTVFTEADALGTVTSHTDPSGNLVDTFTFDSFGWVDAGFDPATDWYLYTGREIDTETALYYYRARYYDPQAGRFLSEDPSGFRGGDINLYRYVGNEPVSFVDPTGRDIAVIENGPTQGNPFGHTAIAITGSGVYSFGNNTDAGSSLEAYLLAQAPRRDTDIYVIQTTPQQDAAALAYLKSLGSPLGKLPIFGGNCSNISNNALSAAGIPAIPLTWGGADAIPDFIPPDIPGTAGTRASLAGAQHLSMPLNSQSVPTALGQFEPTR